MPYIWEDNRRSGVTLAMSYRLKLFVHLRVQWLVREVSIPTTLRKAPGRLYFLMGVQTAR